MAETSVKYLRFNVPLDPNYEDDVVLAEFFESVPNGLKQQMTKMALRAIIPEDEKAMASLLQEVLMESSKRGVRRGRRKKSDGVREIEKIAPSVKKTMVVESQPEMVSAKTVLQVPEAVSAIEERAAEPVTLRPVVEEVLVAKSGNGIEKYSGLLADTGWQ